MLAQLNIPYVGEGVYNTYLVLFKVFQGNRVGISYSPEDVSLTFLELSVS